MRFISIKANWLKWLWKLSTNSEMRNELSIQFHLRHWIRSCSASVIHMQFSYFDIVERASQISDHDTFCWFFSSLCWPCMLVLLMVPYSVAKYDVQHSFWLISKLSKTNFIILLVIYFVSWSVVIGQSAYGNFSFCIIYIRCA